MPGTTRGPTAGAFSDPVCRGCGWLTGATAGAPADSDVTAAYCESPWLPGPVAVIMSPEAPSASICWAPLTAAILAADSRSTSTTTTLRCAAGDAAPAGPAGNSTPSDERAVTSATGMPTARTPGALAGRDMRRSVHRGLWKGAVLRDLRRVRRMRAL